MNFRTKPRDRPDLNLIPMIDVLIVLLIFLVLTTTFRHESAMKIKLPDASAQGASAEKGIEVSIDAEAHVGVDGTALAENSPALLREALGRTSGDRKNAAIIIRADQQTPHQAVMTVLDVASDMGFTRITFATRRAPGGP